jgi:transcription elongation factor Elf1
MTTTKQISQKANEMKRITVKCPECDSQQFRAQLKIGDKSAITLVCARADGRCKASITFRTGGGPK